MTTELKPGRAAGAILLADISGYTAFLESVRVAHENDSFADGAVPSAYGLLSSMLDGIATRIDPPFTLVKFEGDAVFAISPDTTASPTESLLACIRACYEDFGRRRAETGVQWTCTCSACDSDFLDLKFVVHHGDYFVQSVGSHTEVLGPEITIAHRLLKNSAATRLGTTAYALFTDAAVATMALDLGDAEVFVEPIEGAEPVRVRAIPLAA
jgi:class 3 adenylate cyclase